VNLRPRDSRWPPIPSTQIANTYLEFLTVCTDVGVQINTEKTHPRLSKDHHGSSRQLRGATNPELRFQGPRSIANLNGVCSSYCRVNLKKNCLSKSKHGTPSHPLRTSFCLNVPFTTLRRRSSGKITELEYTSICNERCAHG